MENYENNNSNSSNNNNVTNNFQQNQQTTNGKAIASMVLGILSIVVPYIGLLIGIIGLVITKQASNEIKMTGEGGKGFVTTGLVTGIIGVAIWSLVFVVIIISFAIIGSMGSMYY